MSEKAEKRDTSFLVRMTLKEQQAIRKKAEAAHMGNNISRYIRTAALQAKVIDTTPLIDLVREVNRIGNNINQAAHVMHVYCDPEGSDYDYIVHEFDELKNLVYKFVGSYLKWHT